MVKRIAIELLDDAAASSDLLQQMVKGSTKTVTYQTPAYKGGHKYLSIIETKDKNGSPFYHVQRKGKDSVAFLGYSLERPDEFLCLRQWSAPYNMMTTGCYTGSMDKDGKGPQEITAEEAFEEAGVVVPLDHITLVSAEQVGGSSDEIVYLYLVDVTGHRIDDKHPENMYEQLAQRLWLTAAELKEFGDWKAKIILAAYPDVMAKVHPDQPDLVPADAATGLPEFLIVPDEAPALAHQFAALDSSFK